MPVVLAERQGRIGLITLNRPESLNAWGRDMDQELQAAVTEFERDPEVRCLILTGAGRAFSSGANIKDPTTHAVPSAGEGLERISPHGSGTFNAVADCAKPIVAAVNGWALGIGFLITLCCDIILAADTARFGLPQVGIGILPAYGGVLRLARVVGKNKAMEMVLTSRPIDAAEAYRVGLASQVYQPEALLPAALQLAEEIAAKPPLAVRLAKESLLRALDTGSMREAAQADLYRFLALSMTDDREEGHRAWREKRPPVFSGR